MSNAPATAAVVDKPNIASIDLRRKRRRDKRCFAISAASAPPPCKTSYCCGVIDGLSILSSVLTVILSVFQSGDQKGHALQVKVHTLPGPDPEPPRATEKASK